MVVLLWKSLDRGRMVARFWQNGGAKLARISRTGAYELIKKEYFPVIRVGSLIRIPKEPFDAWLDGRGN